MTLPGLAPFRERVAEINDLLCAVSVLNWDASVVMPPGGQEGRARQLASLTRVVRERLVGEEMRRDLELAERSVAGLAASGLQAEYLRREVAQAREAVDLLRRIPDRLVSELAYARTVAQPVWAAARATDDFETFAPSLASVVALTRELADCIGYESHPYDAMLRLYEPDMTVERLTSVFGELRGTLDPLLARVERLGTPDRSGILRQPFSPSLQRQFGMAIAERFGWDPSRGRLDESVHPFEVSFGRGDVRMTTRFRSDSFAPAIFGIMHETGHALYEQNVAPELARTVLTTDLPGMYAVAGTSFGAHESQSRLWENIVGRSRAFWQRHFGELRALFPTLLWDSDPEAVYEAVNEVRPSVIRVEADEVTYNLHILLRTELEEAMLDGSIAVRELPEAWNARMEELLGVVPATAAEGVLQDIHWAHGHIGTFPTYAVGNVMATQLFEAARDQVTGLDEALAQGNYTILLAWLREHVYRHGRAFGVDELLGRATGRPLDTRPYDAYMRAKFEALYPD